jgi:hypothetical protein
LWHEHRPAKLNARRTRWPDRAPAERLFDEASGPFDERRRRSHPGTGRCGRRFWLSRSETMTDDTETIEMIHEDELPGHESRLEPKPDWEPRFAGSGRL